MSRPSSRTARRGLKLRWMPACLALLALPAAAQFPGGFPLPLPGSSAPSPVEALRQIGAALAGGAPGAKQPASSMPPALLEAFRLRSEGKLNDAVTMADQSVAQARAAAGRGSRQGLAQALIMAAEIRLDLGQSGDALPLLEEARTLLASEPRLPSPWGAIPGGSGAVELNQRLGEIYLDLGRHSEARALYAQLAEASAAAGVPAAMQGLQAIPRSKWKLGEGRALQGLGDLRAAEAAYRESIRLATAGWSDAALPPQIAAFQEAMGQARELVAAVSSDIVMVGPSGRPIRTEPPARGADPEALIALAELLAATGQRDALRALAGAEYAPLRSPTSGRPGAAPTADAWRASLQLGLAMARAGLSAEAARVLADAAQFNAAQTDGIARTYAPSLLLGPLIGRRQVLEAQVATLLAQRDADDARRRDVLDLVFDTQGRSLEMEAEWRQLALRSSKPEVRQLAQRLDALAAQELNPRPQADAIASKAKLDSDRITVQNQIRAALGADAADFRFTSGQGWSRQIEAKLGEATLLGYVRYRALDKGAPGVRGTDRYAGYRLRAGHPPRVIDLGSAEDVERNVTRLRAAISLGREGATRADQAGREIWQQIVAPLLGDGPQALPSHGASVLVVPDAELALLPFEMLSDPRGRKAIEMARWTYLASARSLMRERGSAASAAPAARGPSVIVADPDYTASVPTGAPLTLQLRLADGAALRNARFVPLPETRAEAQAVAQALAALGEKKVLSLQGADATAQAFERIASPRVLHVAAHAVATDGFADPLEHPVPGGGVARQWVRTPGLGAALALSGADASLRAGHAGGLLFAANLATMDLRGTELVVLSACDTARGPVRVGEGFMSMRQAALSAGARTVVASLWSVPSIATTQLMSRFYAELARGTPAPDALHRAKLAALRAGEPAAAWAAFTVASAG